MNNNLDQTYWKKIFLLDFFFLKILKYNRLKIHKIFLKNIKNIKKKNILDVGTTPQNDENNNILLHQLKKNNISSLSNLDCSNLKKKFKNVKFFTGDARKMLFKDNTFDVVYSNATIEHVGSYNNQISFVRECLRVSKCYVFITTPNRYYPIDFHTKIPFLHWLPKKIFRKILYYFGFDFFSKEKNLNLLSVKTLHNICGKLNINNYFILRNKFLFFTANLILIIKKN